ncbi:alpha/beta hydrolase [Streptomyces sp. NBC_01431]|uniref:alpha/beta hydrolase n=1 Tax=Streptomyces sp. NBC_01431 TaxID=2903863 RepID=UPI002E2FE79E|nr:alpha/beta hydrolase-fold protein [Streptomyces sp. NBC_01431]
MNRRRPAALLAAAVIGSVVLVAGCSDEGKPVSFDSGASSPSSKASASQAPQKNDPASAKNGAAAQTLLPTGPKAEFTTQSTLADGTKIGVATLQGAKSGFTGKVWVWAPKQYFEDKYKNSGFPVLIALPGGNGYPKNYWMGTDLKLQSSISEWSKTGKSLPFIVVMPVLNPDAKRYYDGSDIPGQPKMGTWMTDDVPDFVQANFRTFKSRDGWAFMGSSSGGFVGLKSVLKRPDRFKAVIASGPDIVPDSPLWAGHEAEKQANNPEKLAQDLITANGPEVALAFQVGTKESAVVPNVQKFIATYGKGPIKTRLQLIEGGTHNAHTYVKGMGEGTMEWISKQMLAPVPSS